MKYLLLLVLASTTALARPVWVQCDVHGPAFKGELEFEEDQSQWVRHHCDSYYGSSAFVITPDFRLSFNGIVYEGTAPETSNVIYAGINCSGEVKRGAPVATSKAVNAQTGYEAKASFNYGNDSSNRGSELRSLKITGPNSKSCSVKFRD
jgi:hypothetical protein